MILYTMHKLFTYLLLYNKKADRRAGTQEQETRIKIQDQDQDQEKTQEERTYIKNL